MVKHSSDIYHRISRLYADPVMNSVEFCISYGEFPRGACVLLDHVLILNSA